MHIDPEKLGKAIGNITAKLGIQSEPGKVLFGLECVLSFVLLVAVGIFALHDIVMVLLERPGDEAMEAFKWSLAVFVVSMLIIVARERFVGRMDK
jgi:hypothetical protein